MFQCWVVVGLTLGEFITDKGAVGEKVRYYFFVHVQSGGSSRNIAVIKVTITQTYGNKMHAIIVFAVSKLQETLPNLSHLILQIGWPYVPLGLGWPLFL